MFNCIFKSMALPVAKAQQALDDRQILTFIPAQVAKHGALHSVGTRQTTFLRANKQKRVRGQAHVPSTLEIARSLSSPLERSGEAEPRSDSGRAAAPGGGLREVPGRIIRALRAEF